MTFEEEYPEFGGSKAVEESIKTCPCCCAIFTMYKELKKNEFKLEKQ